MINSVEIKNFGGIDALKLNLKKFMIIQGRSMQGKTTILQAIRWAIFGDNNDALIRNGTESCEVILNSSNGSRIERRMARGGTSKLFVYTKDNAQIPEPQKFLKNAFNPLPFNPVEMLSMNDKALGEFISSAISQRVNITEEDKIKYRITHLDLSTDPVKVLQKYYEKAFEERTEVNRAIKEYETKTQDLVENVTKDKIDNLSEEIKILDNKIEKIKVNNMKIEIGKRNVEIKIKTENNIKTMTETLSSLPKENAVDLSNKESALYVKQSEMESSYNHFKIKKETLTETINNISSGEIKCPLVGGLACKTDMKEYKIQIESSIKSVSEEMEILFKQISEIREERNGLTKLIMSAKDRSGLEIELERAKSILKELEICDGELIDRSAIEVERDQKRALLSNMELSFKMLDVSNIILKRERQKDLNMILETLNELIKVEIPKRLKLDVSGVTFEDGKLLFQGLPITRQGSSFKLRLCTAILKNLFPKSNLFTLDGCECIDEVEFKKFAERTASLSDVMQYIVSYVGDIQIENPNIGVVTMERFTVKS